MLPRRRQTLGLIAYEGVVPPTAFQVVLGEAID